MKEKQNSFIFAYSNDGETSNMKGRQIFLTNRLIHASGLLFMIEGMLDYQNIFILSNPTHQTILKGIDSIKVLYKTYRLTADIILFSKLLATLDQLIPSLLGRNLQLF